MKSMTAFGQATLPLPSGRLLVEIHGVNRKMLDMHIHIPQEFLSFDIAIRKWISERVERGNVTARITVQQDTLSHASASYVAALKALKTRWENIATEIGFNPEEVLSLDFLVDQMQQYSLPNDETPSHFEEKLKKACDEALNLFIQMKEREGKALADDILMRLKLIEEHLALIKKTAPEAAKKYEKKLRQNIQEASLADASNIQDRLLTEIALFSTKIDITEEIVRLHSHCEQFKKAAASKEKSVGRTLEFLLQEMQREVNTIAAKATIDPEIPSHIVKIKAELEKIREQVQNIE